MGKALRHEIPPSGERQDVTFVRIGQNSDKEEVVKFKVDNGHYAGHTLSGKASAFPNAATFERGKTRLSVMVSADWYAVEKDAGGRSRVDEGDEGADLYHVEYRLSEPREPSGEAEIEVRRTSDKFTRSFETGDYVFEPNKLKLGPNGEPPVELGGPDRLTPRHYQREACVATRKKYEEGYNRLLARLPTGTGKTSGFAANLPDYFPRHVETTGDEGGILFLSHRIEIIRQAHETFEEAYGHERWIGLEQGPHEATGHEDFVFMSVDSGGREVSDRIHKYEGRKFGMIIVDEGHHPTVGGTWDNVLTFFGVGSDSSLHYGLFGGEEKPVVVFMTATPERNDGQSLEPFIDAVAYDYNILDAIRDGWLCDIRAFQAVEQQGAWEGMDQEAQVDFLIKTWKEYAEGMNTLCFAGSVDQSDLLARTLNAEGIARASHIDAQTEEDIRADDVDAFRRGEIEFLSNRFVFTEGFDSPLIECILDNGPTESEQRHIQKVGRGLRPHPDAGVDACETAEERRQAIRNSPKPFLTYIATFDPKVHGLDVVASILGKDTPMDAEGHLLFEEVVDVLEEMEDEEGERPAKDVSSMSDLEVALKEVDVWDRTIQNEELKARTELRWVIRSDTDAALWMPVNPHQSELADDTEAMFHVEEDPEGGVIVRHVRAGGYVEGLSYSPPIAPAKILSEGRFPSLNEAIRRTDEWMKGRHPEIYSSLVRSGMSTPATDEQKRYMKNQSIAFGNGIKQGQADILIDDFKITRKLQQTGLLS